MIVIVLPQGLQLQDLRICPLNPPSEGLLARGTLTSLPPRIGGLGGRNQVNRISPELLNLSVSLAQLRKSIKMLLVQKE